MKGKTSILKIYISESDKIESTLLYDLIVNEAHEAKLAGATVHRGILSFGASHAIHTRKVYSLPNNIPIIIEIIDEEDKIRQFSKRVKELIDQGKKGALVTIHPVEVIEYKPGDKYNVFDSF